MLIYFSFHYVDAKAIGHDSLWSGSMRLELSEVFIMMIMVMDEIYSSQ